MIIADKKMIKKRLKFKLKSCRWTPKIEIRIIHGITESGSFIVSYNGWKKSFYVKPHEAIEIIET